MAAENTPNQSVERAVGLLRALAQSHHGQHASSLAAAAGLGLSTATRLLATLEGLDMVERDPISGAYRLGPLAVTIGGAATNQSPVFRESRQLMQNLAATVGLGVNLARRNGDHLEYLFNVEGTHAPRSFTLSGQRNPLHSTGLGKCLLTGLTAAARRELLPEAELKAFTARTITSHETLDEEIATILRRGYAKEMEELALGRACVAAPIRDHNWSVVAAVSVSGPLSALDLGRREEELGRTVIELADTISVGLGYLPTGLQASPLTGLIEPEEAR